MKVRDLIAELRKHDPEMDIEICTGSWECDPTNKPVEAVEFEHKNWKYNSETGRYDELPSDTRLTFTEHYEKPLKGEVISDHKSIEL